MNLAPTAIQKFFDNNGRPVGGLLFTYAAGTSNKIATYVDSSGSTPNTNPIELDFRGECRLWIDPTLSYKFVLAPRGDTDPPGDPIWTVDNITAGPAQQDNAATDTGSVNNVQLSIPQISSPVAFTRIVFKAAQTNTGPVTISINGGSAKALTWQNAAPLSGWEIQAGGIYEAIYDGAQFQLQSPALAPPQIRTAAEVAAGVSPASPAYEPGNVLRYMTFAQITDVLAGTLSVDVTAAFATALSCNAEVVVPDGSYRTDAAIEVSGGKKLRLSKGALLQRVAAASATTPVVYILGIKSEVTGGTLSSLKASPSGVVCLGHKDNAEERLAYWWRFANCNVQGRGQSGDIGVYIPSGQVTVGVASSNYFGCITNINILGFDVGMQFAEFANAHNVTNLQFWECRTVCLELRGAIENNITGMFMHTGLVNGLIGIRLTNKALGTQESTLNNIIGFTVETSGGSDQSLVIQSACSGNTIIGNSNVSGGFTISNRSNLVILDGAQRCGTSIETDALQADTRVIIANGTGATAKGFLQNFNQASSTPPGGTVTLPLNPGSGLLLIRNASDGGTATVQVDSLTGADVILDPDNFVTVGADPGAGSSQFWVEADATSVRITNRYAASKFIRGQVVSIDGAT